MDFKKMRERELVAEQLKAISPLVKLARRIFIADEALRITGPSKYFDNEIRTVAHLLSRSILELEKELKILSL